MNKNIKAFILSIITVLLVGVIVGGSTFAYFQWSSSDAQKTNVNVTIKHGGITMHIDSEQKSFVGLRPTADCTTNRKFTASLVTIVNNTGALALPSFKLKARVTKGGSGTLTSDALSHINYSVVQIPTYVDDNEDLNVRYEDTWENCNTPSTISSGNYFTNSSTVASGNFQNVSTSGAWTNLPSASNEYLPRQYNTSTGEVSGITFKALAYSTTYQYFFVFVWIDDGYTTTTVGNTVSDPLQNAKIEITWSEDSMVQQVSG